MELSQVFPVGGVCVFVGGGGGWWAVDTNDWCIISHYVRLLGRCITLTPIGPPHPAPPPPSILVNWRSPFPVLGVSGYFFIFIYFQ